MKICLAAPLVNHSLLCTGGVKHIDNQSDNKIKNVFLMKIFLAGGISGNLRDFWSKVMKIYCASPRSRGEVIEAMKVFIAGDNNKKKILRENLFGSDFLAGENALKERGIYDACQALRVFLA